jgi:hypothetical protein
VDQRSPSWKVCAVGYCGRSVIVLRWEHTRIGNGITQIPTLPVPVQGLSPMNRLFFFQMVHAYVVFALLRSTLHLDVDLVGTLLL